MGPIRTLGAGTMVALALSLASAGALSTPAAAQGYPWGGPGPTYPWGGPSPVIPWGGPTSTYGPSSPGGGMYGLGAAPYRYPRTPAPTYYQHVRLYIGDGAFFPAEISVPLYTRVTWQNGGRAPQTVTSPGIWDSGPIQPGGRWSAIFAVPGTFEYVSTLDPNLRGRITVMAP